MEYMDIVNEDDEVIGRGTRKYIHDTYQIHRGVHVLVQNSKEEILIQKRSMSKAYYPGYYDISVGAQVSSGESYEEAALRELVEELGCHTRPLIPIAYYDAFSSRQREKRRLYLLSSDGPFKLDKREVEGIEFFALDHVTMLLQQRPFTEGCKKSLYLYVNYLRSGRSEMMDTVRAKAVLDAACLGE